MKGFFGIVLLISFCFSCSKNDNLYNCQNQIIIDSDTYTNGPFDPGTKVYDAHWDGSCFEIFYGYSGCSNLHLVEVASDNSILKTMPPQITFAIIHENLELCDAAFSESIEIDISELAVFQEYDKFIIRFENSDFTYQLEK